MTEKQKMANGILYDANDQELKQDRLRMKKLLFEYNRLAPEQEKERELLLRKAMGRAGADFLIEPPFYCDYGYHIEFGEHFYANTGLVILDGAKVTIGNHVLIGPNVGIYTAGHPLETDIRDQGMEYAYPVVIGDHVWIGGGVQIVPGVCIGDNSVIGAGSVVTKDIPANVIAAGNPCRVLRTL